MLKPRCPGLAFLLANWLLASACQAEVVSWQGFDIHYTTFNSLLIPQTVADAHKITRSKNRIVTNITVRKNNKPVRAIIRGTNRNLLNQLFQMEFDEVIEQGAVYYLANQIIDERDSLKFSIDIQPLNQTDVYHLEFARQY